MIQPGLIVDAALALLENRSLQARWLRDEHVRIYRTRISTDDSQLELIRLGNFPDDTRDIYQFLMRRLWPRWLNEEAAVPDVSELSLPAQFTKAAASAFQLAGRAQNFCGSLSGRRSKQEILPIARELNDVEGELYTLLQQHEVLRSMLAFLQIEKSSVRGSDLQIQARETEAIYGRFIKMLSPLASVRIQKVVTYP
jgi:hypothetical protein